MKSKLRETRDHLSHALQAYEPAAIFRSRSWRRPGGGGGVTRVLQHGTTFDSVGLGFSLVYGDISADAIGAALGIGQPQHRPPNERLFFQAIGLSVVVHPLNPMVPSLQTNYRYICYEAPDESLTWWFGGVANLTPYYLFDEDISHFHRQYKEVCDGFDQSYYHRFKKECDEYFYIRHRGEHRGTGGIFFDGLNDREPERLFGFVSACLDVTWLAYGPILERRMSHPFNEGHLKWQRLRRGRYIEFNLIYDRGTLFGLKTGADSEALLMSMPPAARWEFDHRPETGSEEERLLKVLKAPRRWV